MSDRDSRAQERPLRVVMWGTSDAGKPRVRILRDGLRANGVDLLECRKDIWGAIADKSQVGAATWCRLLAANLFAYPALIWRYLRLPAHDWVLLAYPAIPDIFVIRLFAWMRGAGVAMDWFLSAYDTVVLDRALVGSRHPLAWILRIIEWLAVRLADQVFMDTRAHAQRMEGLFGLPHGRCGSVWVGAEAGFFRGSDAGAAERPRECPLQVLFYGQFIPLHGIGTIIEAARELRDQPIDWLLVGKGQEATRIRSLLDDAPLPRLRWLEWVDYDNLGSCIAEADICLGIFGTSDKAASVIPNKVFQVVAAGRPLVTLDSPASRELLSPTPGCVYLVPGGDARALADALLAHRAALQAGARVCHRDLQARVTPAIIGRQLLDILLTREART